MTRKRPSRLKDVRRVVRRRLVLIVSLTGVLLVLFAGNLYLMSFGAEIGARPVCRGCVITIALAYSIGLIAVSAGVTAFYAWWSNRHLRSLTDAAEEERGRSGAGSDDA